MRSILIATTLRRHMRTDARVQLQSLPIIVPIIVPAYIGMTALIGFHSVFQSVLAPSLTSYLWCSHLSQSNLLLFHKSLILALFFVFYWTVSVCGMPLSFALEDKFLIFYSCLLLLIALLKQKIQKNRLDSDLCVQLIFLY